MKTNDGRSQRVKETITTTKKCEREHTKKMHIESNSYIDSVEYRIIDSTVASHFNVMLCALHTHDT